MGVSLAQITGLLLTTKAPISCIPPSRFGVPVILISGTQNARDLLIDDLDIRPAHWPPSNEVHGGTVHRGFARRTRVLFKRIHKFVHDNNNFVIAGHSMGGACGVLMASMLHDTSNNVEAVYTFGMPRMSSYEFRKYYKNNGLNDISRHFTTPKDPVVYRIPYIYDTVGDYEIIPCHNPDEWVQHDMKSYYAVWNPSRPST
jgi:hypothetical protein